MFEIIRGLIQKVRLVPMGGTLTIELSGDLAGILALSEAGKSDAAAASGALQIKMVAGVRFEPTIFRPARIAQILPMRRVAPSWRFSKHPSYSLLSQLSCAA